MSSLSRRDATADRRDRVATEIILAPRYIVYRGRSLVHRVACINYIYSLMHPRWRVPE